MLHLRVISPTDLTERVLARLTEDRGVVHLWVASGAARRPAGDLIGCDVPRESATDLIEALQAIGLRERGSIVLESVDISISAAGERAVRDAPGAPADALVWSGVEQNTGEETGLTWSYLVFMVVATILASIGVVLDQPILIVGAMVVGPEFGPLAGFCVAVVAGAPRRALRALGTLTVGFAVGMLATVLSTWGLDRLGLVDQAMLEADRPLTGFIWQPDALSWVVGFLAGIAGMLSLTSAKSGALVGVLISVTTIPAAGNAAAALAYGVTEEALGSGVQLLVNLASIVVGGVLTLTVQRARHAWMRSRHGEDAGAPESGPTAG